MPMMINGDEPLTSKFIAATTMTRILQRIYGLCLSGGKYDHKPSFSRLLALAIEIGPENCLFAHTPFNHRVRAAR